MLGGRLCPRIENRLLANQPGNLIRIKLSRPRFLHDDVPIGERIKHVPFGRASFLPVHLGIVGKTLLERVQGAHVVFLVTIYLRDRQIDLGTVRPGFRSASQFFKRPFVDPDHCSIAQPLLFAHLPPVRQFLRRRRRFAGWQSLVRLRNPAANFAAAFDSSRSNAASQDSHTNWRRNDRARLVKRSGFREFSGAFRIASCPVTGAPAIIVVLVDVNSEMFSQELRRLRKIAGFVGRQARSNCACATSTEPGAAFTAARRSMTASASFLASSAICPALTNARGVETALGNARRNSSTVARACSHCRARA